MSGLTDAGVGVEGPIPGFGFGSGILAFPFAVSWLRSACAAVKINVEREGDVQAN